MYPLINAPGSCAIEGNCAMNCVRIIFAIFFFIACVACCLNSLDTFDSSSDADDADAISPGSIVSEAVSKLCSDDVEVCWEGMNILRNYGSQVNDLFYEMFDFDGIDRNTPITVVLRNCPFKNVKFAFRDHFEAFQLWKMYHSQENNNLSLSSCDGDELEFEDSQKRMRNIFQYRLHNILINNPILSDQMIEKVAAYQGFLESYFKEDQKQMQNLSEIEKFEFLGTIWRVVEEMERTGRFVGVKSCKNFADMVDNCNSNDNINADNDSKDNRNFVAVRYVSNGTYVDESGRLFRIPQLHDDSGFDNENGDILIDLLSVSSDYEDSGDEEDDDEEKNPDNTIWETSKDSDISEPHEHHDDTMISVSLEPSGQPDSEIDLVNMINDFDEATLLDGVDRTVYINADLDNSLDEPLDDDAEKAMAHEAVENLNVCDSETDSDESDVDEGNADSNANANADSNANANANDGDDDIQVQVHIVHENSIARGPEDGAIIENEGAEIVEVIETTETEEDSSYHVDTSGNIPTVHSDDLIEQEVLTDIPAISNSVAITDTNPLTSHQPVIESQSGFCETIPPPLKDPSIIPKQPSASTTVSSKSKQKKVSLSSFFDDEETIKALKKAKKAKKKEKKESKNRKMVYPNINKK